MRLARAATSRSAVAAFALALGAWASACGGGAEVHFPTPACTGDQIACGLRCADVATDPTNCGGCGIPCATGQMCVGGACACPAETIDCNGACVAAGTPGCTVSTGDVVVTSAPGAYWNTDGTVAEVTAGVADVTVNEGDTRQIWEGFGGAFNEMGWDALSTLSDADRATAIRLLYGADGARFAFGRIPIGASDYARDRYTLDETPGDTSLADFSIARDMEALIPFVKAAQAVKPGIRLWASPWTPPTWMKDGPFSPGNQVSPFDGGSMKSDDATLEAFAQYLVRFVQAYAEQGIAIEAISAQNEPGYTGNYPTCDWSPSTYTKLLGQHLGPAVSAAGLTTKIMLGTFNGGDGDDSIISDVMGDGVAQTTVSVLGFQWGMQSRVAGARPYHLPVWQTEHKCGNYPWGGTRFDATHAPNDQPYAVETWGLIRDWIRAGVTAYSAWNMVLDTVGTGIDTTRVWPQNALLTVDTAAHTLNVTPAYYVFRHVSQFVATGARVVTTSGGDALAFRNPDGAVVAVVRNEGAARTMTVAAFGRKLQLAVPADGWATIVTR